MNNYILMGGRDKNFTGKSKILNSIFQFKDTNDILYIPLANDNYLEGLKHFVDQINRKINIRVLDINNINEFKELTLKYEIIIIPGGCYNLLYERLSKYELIDHFKSLDNKVILGISAGAILLCEYGMGDKDVFIDNNEYYNFKMVKGLGILPYTICPHYQKNELVIFNDIYKEYPFDAFCLEDDTAILISGSDIDIIKDTLRNSVYKINKNNGYILTPLYERKN